MQVFGMCRKAMQKRGEHANRIWIQALLLLASFQREQGGCVVLCLNGKMQYICIDIITPFYKFVYVLYVQKSAALTN